jgi:hypothetical protein
MGCLWLIFRVIGRWVVVRLGKAFVDAVAGVEVEKSRVDEGREKTKSFKAEL